MNKFKIIKDTINMLWYLFFIVLIFILSLPLSVKAKIKFNILNMAGEFSIKIGFLKLKKIKVKIKNNYIYITKKGLTYKEKLAPNNIDVVFFANLIKSLYFRGVLVEFIEKTEIGYKNSAMATAFACASIDLAFKGVLAKIKTNKKFSKICIDNSPVYEQDKMTLNFDILVSLNIFDVLYSLIGSKINAKGTKYEKEQDIEHQLGIDN